MQDSPGAGINDFYWPLLELHKPDIIVFPEYYFVKPDDPDPVSSAGRKDEILQLLIGWSIHFKCLIIGGSLVEEEDGKFFNRCHVVNQGNIIGHYDKIHLFRNEGRGRISSGYEYKVFEIPDLRFGVIICADVLFPHVFANLRGLGPELIFVPTTSPYRPGETISEKFARDDEIFAKGAALADSVIFKASACGTIAGHRLQGRSLIASPGVVRWRIEPENEDKSALILSVLTGDISNPLLDTVVLRR